MTQQELVALSPAETEVLRIVWELKEANVQQVADQLPPGRDIGYATVQTLLRRLEKKGYITHRKVSKAHVFSAVAKQEEVISRTVGDFVNRLFGGDPLPLVQYLAQNGGITSKDLEELQSLVDNAE